MQYLFRISLNKKIKAVIKACCTLLHNEARKASRGLSRAARYNGREGGCLCLFNHNIIFGKKTS